MEIEKLFFYEAESGKTFIGKCKLIRCPSTGKLYWTWKAAVKPCSISEKPEGVVDVRAVSWIRIANHPLCLPYEDFPL